MEKNLSDDESLKGSSDKEESKRMQALQKDMHQMMKEFKAIKGSSSKSEGELWCTDCKEGHTKGTCPKKVFCDICQVLGYSKQCPYNMKTRTTQLLFVQENPSIVATTTSFGNY